MGKVSDIMGLNPQHLEASRSIFSSQFIRTGELQSKFANFIFFKRYRYPTKQAPNPSEQSSTRASTRRRPFGAPSAAQLKERDSVRTKFGGAERDRTADPLLAKQVLSQLSYSPNHHKHLPVTRQDQQNPNIQTINTSH
jgi:hypothetical protein